MTTRGLAWLAAIAACIGLWVGAWHALGLWKESLREEGRVEVREQWNEAVRIVQRAENIRAAALRKKEQEASDETASALSRLAGAAASASRARDGLQRRVEELVAAARRQPAACAAAGEPAPGEQGADPIGMLADVQGRIDEAAERVGDYADQLRVAGLGCERSHDAVTAP